MNTTTYTAGKFSSDGKSITGPADYLRERGDALLAKINAGTDAILNNTAHYSPNPIIAILVRLQTDYAAWQGMKLTARELGIA